MGKEMKEITAKINKTRSGFFEKTTKIDKPLAKLIKNKRRIKSTKLEMKKERLQQCRNTKVIRDYYEQLYNNKWITWTKCTDS